MIPVIRREPALSVNITQALSPATEVDNYLRYIINPFKRKGYFMLKQGEQWSETTRWNVYSALRALFGDRQEQARMGLAVLNPWTQALHPNCPEWLPDVRQYNIWTKQSDDINENDVSRLVVDLMTTRAEWKGNAADLGRALKITRNGKLLRNQLQEVVPYLLLQGIKVGLGTRHERNGKQISISRI